MEDTQFIQRLEALATEIESCTEPALRDRLQNAVRTLLEFHGRGLGRIMQHLSESGSTGAAIINAVSADQLTSSLLLLHDLHPWDQQTRVRRAVEAAAPEWASNGLQIHDLTITPEGSVLLRVSTAGQGRRPSAAAMKSAIERVILAAAPDVTGLSIEGLLPAPAPVGFVPVSGVRILRSSTGRSGTTNVPSEDAA